MRTGLIQPLSHCCQGPATSAGELSCVQHAAAPDHEALLQTEGKERKRYPPLPLSTLELQKKATGILRLPGERIMHLAEELYQAGFVSYPRTETDVFDPQMNLMVGGSLHTWCCSGPGWQECTHPDVLQLELEFGLLMS